MKSLSDLLPCPECGSGDIRWCAISVRPYCGDCGYWAPVNHGTDEDAVNDWNKKSRLVHGLDLDKVEASTDYLQLLAETAKAIDQADKCVSQLCEQLQTNHGLSLAGCQITQSIMKTISSDVRHANETIDAFNSMLKVEVSKKLNELNLLYQFSTKRQ